MQNILLSCYRNISTAHSNIGYLAVLLINLSVLLPMQGNNYANNLAICLTNSCELTWDFGHSLS